MDKHTNGQRGFDASYKLSKDGNEAYLWRDREDSSLFQVATEKVLLDDCVIVVTTDGRFCKGMIMMQHLLCALGIYNFVRIGM